jgi:trk system potassium uptake protein TrkA
MGKTRSLISLAKGQAEILELTFTNGKLDGKKISEIGMPQNTLISMINRNGEVIICSKDEVLKLNDLLTLVIQTETVKDAVKILKGE